MTVRSIVRLPDHRLRAVSEPVLVFDEELRRLATDLADTMHAAPGIGITAPHIGILKRLVVIEVSPAAGLRASRCQVSRSTSNVMPAYILSGSGRRRADRGGRWPAVGLPPARD